MKPTVIGLAALLALLVAGSARAETSGRMLADTCGGCHGVRGASAGPTMPSLAGMPEDFLLAAMKQFRDGTRSSTIMGRIARGYSDEQLAAMSGFLARQRWVSAPQKADLALAGQGRKLHLKRCEACHREGGASTALDMPRMAGQWSGYLQIYLETCRDPAWKHRHGGAMADLCTDLGPDDLAALMQYYASDK